MVSYGPRLTLLPHNSGSTFDLTIYTVWQTWVRVPFTWFTAPECREHAADTLASPTVVPMKSTPLETDMTCMPMTWFLALLYPCPVLLGCPALEARLYKG